MNSVKFFVGNISYNISEEDLKQDLYNAGINTLSIKIARDRETRLPRGFAFIEVDEPTSQYFLETVRGLEIDGRPLRAEKAEQQQPAQNVRVNSDRPAVRPGNNTRFEKPGTRPLDNSSRFKPREESYEDTWREESPVRRRRG